MDVRRRCVNMLPCGGASMAPSLEILLDVTLSRVTQSGDPSPGMLRYAHTWTGMRIPGSHRGIRACIPDEVSATRVD